MNKLQVWLVWGMVTAVIFLSWRGCQVSEYEDCLVGPHSGNPEIAQLCGRILDKNP